MNKFVVICADLGFALIASFLLGLLFAYPIMVTWNNALVGAISGVNTIGFWQAFEIMILCSLLSKPITSSSSKE